MKIFLNKKTLQTFPSVILNWHFYFWLIYIMLVLCGITGSSLGEHKNNLGAQEVITLVGEKKLLGVYRYIRSDEYIAHGTPNAIAQFNHNPQFPKINNNLGLEGRNFSLIHDLGIPVLDASTIFRPATWGFFLFDLRRSLAWYWLFPIFFGIWSITIFFNFLWPTYKKTNFLFATAIVFSPYSAAWSFWPTYNAMGVCFACAMGLRLLKGISWKTTILYSILIGWGLGVSAMSLYFPRVFPISLLLSLFCCAYISKNHLWGEFKKSKIICAILISLLFLGTVFAIWYVDNAQAISLVRNSAYPGVRRDYGGTIGVWALAKGFLIIFSMIKNYYLNSCEMQAEISLLIPFAFYIFIFWRRLKNNVLIYSVVFFMLFLMCYQYIGFPKWLGDISFFTLCNPPRLGGALTFSQFLLIAILGTSTEINRDDSVTFLQKVRMFFLTFKGKIVVIFISIASVIGVLLVAPKELWQGLDANFSREIIIGIGMSSLIIYILLIYLLFSNFQRFAIMFALVNIFLGAIFNPICIAPKRIDNHINEVIDTIKPLKYGGAYTLGYRDKHISSYPFPWWGKGF